MIPMQPDKSSYLIEQILHQTQSRPFSLHHAVVYPNMTSALYLHCHSEMEFFYLEQGNVQFQIEDAKFTLQAGDAIFIPPNLLHSAKRMGDPTEDCSFYAIVFSLKMIMDITPSYCEHYFYPVLYSASNCMLPIHSSEEWQFHILELLKNIFIQSNTQIEDCELILRGNLLIIWQLLYNHHMAQIQMNHSCHQTYPQLRECVDFISNHYMENISLKILSHNAGLSEGHFCRLFKDFTGFTPFQYINRKRITKSCEYLTQSNKKIAEIATLCGYNNISYYNRAFLQLMQETPSSYRKHFIHT